MKGNRITKKELAEMVSMLTPGKGIETKFYNPGGTVMVTFACLKSEYGQTIRKFSIGKKARIFYDCTDFEKAWYMITVDYKLQPPKELMHIKVSKRMVEKILGVDRLMRSYNNDCRRSVNEGRMQAESLNRRRIQDYTERKDVFCHGIGLRYVKLFLNRIIKDGDNVAKMYRLALEIEGVNLEAKKALMKYHSDYYNYDKKEEMLRELIFLCRGQNVNYGVQHSVAPAATHVIYFDLPECDQISFHTNLEEAESLPVYNGEWDGQKCSTMGKLESAIWTRYENRLREKFDIV